MVRSNTPAFRQRTKRLQHLVGAGPPGAAKSTSSPSDWPISARASNCRFTKPVRPSELGGDVCQGCRICYTIRSRVVIIVLCGGSKSTQTRDIRRAKDLARAV
jgi:hypothetical protein